MLYLLDIHIPIELGIGIFVLIATFYFYLGVQRSLQLARKAKIKLWGEEALATILFIEKDESRPAKKRYKIQIQVEPVLGRNFVIEMSNFPREYINSIKVGDKIWVKYLAKNPKDLIFIKPAILD